MTTGPGVTPDTGTRSPPDTPAPVPQQQQQQRDQVMNAGAGGGGGVVEDEEHDILYWMFLTSRFVLLLSIVYFYGSLSRLIFVAFVAGVIYFYQVF